MRDRGVARFLDVVVGLGSNLGDRRSTIEAAVCRLHALPGTRVVSTSALIETAPLGDVPQGPYLNGAARLETSLAASELMAQLLVIEASLGRERRVRWGPRTIDLDVLWIAGCVVDEPSLTVPHPGLVTRVFALAPLVEVAPAAVDPRDGRSYRDVLAALTSA